MSQVRAMAGRSMALAVFASVMVFTPPFRTPATVVLAWGIVLLLLGLATLVGVGAAENLASRRFARLQAGAGLVVGTLSIVAGFWLGPGVLPWSILVYAVVAGGSELAMAASTPRPQRSDHAVLGGATVLLGLASLVVPQDPTWLLGIVIVWATVCSVVAGTASVSLKDAVAESRERGTSR